jgi:hypothetical protein
MTKLSKFQCLRCFTTFEAYPGPTNCTNCGFTQVKEANAHVHKENETPKKQVAEDESGPMDDDCMDGPDVSCGC